MPNNRNLIYEGVQTINCNLSNHIIIGEDTYLLNCSISDYVQINRRNIMENVVVGECTYTGANTVVKHSVIGKYCSLSWNISATGNYHDYERITTHPFVHLKSFAFVDNDDKSNFKPISIGNDVWIGANVCVLPGVNIGDGAVIGAGSVVTKSIPPYAIVVGNPARIIKYRFPEDIVVLLEKAKWWNWPREIIMKNMSLFNSKMTKEIAEQLYELSKEIRCYE